MKKVEDNKVNRILPIYIFVYKDAYKLFQLHLVIVKLINNKIW